MLQEIAVQDININLGTKTSPIFEKEAQKDVQIILFKVNYSNFENSYNKKICGKTCLEYVKKVCAGFKTIETEISASDDPIFYAKSLLDKSYKFTALLFTDTPLLTTSTFLGAVDYARLKNVNMIRLYRGFVFNTDYLCSLTNLYLKEPMDFEPQDFLVCKNFKSLNQINQIMQERIYNYHFENGVEIVGNPIIDADAFIEKGSKVIGASQILGATQIGEGVIVNNSVLSNAIVGKNSVINKACVSDSILQNDVKVEPFSIIKNKSIVCNNVTVKSLSKINNQKVEN